MNPMTTDERLTYFWEKEKSARIMAEIARDIWHDAEKERLWMEEARRCKQEQSQKA